MRALESFTVKFIWLFIHMCMYNNDAFVGQIGYKGHTVPIFSMFGFPCACMCAVYVQYSTCNKGFHLVMEHQKGCPEKL